MLQRSSSICFCTNRCQKICSKNWPDRFLGFNGQILHNFQLTLLTSALLKNIELHDNFPLMHFAYMIALAALLNKSYHQKCWAAEAGTACKDLQVII